MQHMVDRELLLGFIDESLDMLDEVDSLLVKLEAGGAQRELISAIFRPIHSIKGNAAYFGLMKIKKLSHRLEDLLDRVREGFIAVDSEIVDILLPGVDLLRNMFITVRTSDSEMSDGEKLQAVLGEIDRVLTGGKNLQSVDVTQLIPLCEKLQNLVGGEAKSLVEKIIQLVSTTDSKTYETPAECELVTSFIALLHTDTDGETILERIDELEKQLPSKAAIVRDMRECADTFLHAGIGLDELALSILEEKAHLLSSVSKSSDSSQSNVASKKESEGNFKEGYTKSSDSAKTLRITESVLDEFLSYVGELLEAEELFRGIVHKLTDSGIEHSLLKDIQNIIFQFERISGMLRKSVMKIRKVEASQLFRKVPRLVRDISKKLGKKIIIQSIGEELLIDKSYVDLLDAPLTHIVRNSVDHGIELPQDRKNSGKSETGTIRIELSENEKEITLSIGDDGRGLNLEGLRQKALSMELIKEGEQLSEEATIDLIFSSGVSTAEAITDVSGRGVGMDVVKRAIEGCGGAIHVHSLYGQGCRFSILLPRNVTTQIIDGYVVGSGSGETYIFPLSTVVESFSFNSVEVTDVAERGKLLKRRDSVYPLFFLDDILEVAKEPVQKGLVVLFTHGHQKCCIVVSDIIGIQKVVKKDIDGTSIKTPLFDGAAITGSNKISMVLNPEYLANSLTTL